MTPLKQQIPLISFSMRKVIIPSSKSPKCRLLRECWIYVSENYVFSFKILCQQQCKEDISKSSVTTTELPLTMNISLNGCEWVKNCSKNDCVRWFFDRTWRLDKLKILINKISARSLALLIFAIGWEGCGQPQPRHESMMPVLSFSPLSI